MSMIENENDLNQNDITVYLDEVFKALELKIDNDPNFKNSKLSESSRFYCKEGEFASYYVTMNRKEENKYNIDFTITTPKITVSTNREGLSSNEISNVLENYTDLLKRSHTEEEFSKNISGDLNSLKAFILKGVSGDQKEKNINSSIPTTQNVHQERSSQSTENNKEKTPLQNRCSLPMDPIVVNTPSSDQSELNINKVAQNQTNTTIPNSTNTNSTQNNYPVANITPTQVANINSAQSASSTQPHVPCDHAGCNHFDNSNRQ